jgi:hypothetical protein
MRFHSVIEQLGGAVADSGIGGSADCSTVADAPPSFGDLPPANVRRWTIRRKAAVLAAVANNVLTREEACQRYQLSEQEFASWQQVFETHGLAGLRATRLQHYRGRPPRSR